MTIQPESGEGRWRPLEIMEGKHDDALESIQNACRVAPEAIGSARVRSVRPTGTTERRAGRQDRHHHQGEPKSISVGVGDPKTEFGDTYYPEGSYNVPPRMLEAV